MRIAIFSDVHGNLSALEAVLDHIDQQEPVDQIVFAGDACLAGPRPLECIAELRSRKITCIVGNTDHWILHPPSLIKVSDDDAREKRLNLRDLCRWTQETIGKEGTLWLEELRSSFSVSISPTPSHDQDLLIVHANPKDLLQIIFPSEERQKELYSSIRQPDEELGPLFSEVKASMIAFGHLHIPSLRTWRNFSLANISSVSLPGDGDPRAKYAVVKWQGDQYWEVEWHRIDYAIEGEIEAYLENQPPNWKEGVEMLRTSGSIAQEV
jgi:predicted phosphodiesterase